MVKRRKANGEGTIYKRKDGTYCAQEYIDGRRITGYGKTQTQARRSLKENLKAAVKEGIIPPVKSKSLLLKDFLPYCNSVMFYGNEKTQRWYKVLFKRICRYIGNIPVHQVNQETMVDLFKGLSLSYQPSSVKRTMWFASRIFYVAQEQGYIPENQKINIKELYPKEPVYKELPSPEKVFECLSKIRSAPMRFLGLFALFTGLRRGELIGLKWEDIDMESGVIRINTSISCLPDSNVITVGPPKNGIKGQVVQMPKEAKDLLAEAKRFYERENIQSPFVFCKEDGTHLNPRSVSTRLGYALRKVSSYGAVHILRHLNATIMAKNNISVRTISQQLRHSRISTTDKYINAIINEEREEIKNMDFSFARSSKTAVNQSNP